LVKNFNLNVPSLCEKDDNNEDCAIVLVDSAKYVCNYYPDMVLNITSDQFDIVSKIDIDKIKNIIGVE
jgi:hypothetical protein